MKTLTIDDVENLLAEMRKTGRPAVVDWINANIRVLSEERGEGKYKYLDILYEVK